MPLSALKWLCALAIALACASCVPQTPARPVRSGSFTFVDGLAAAAKAPVVCATVACVDRPRLAVISHGQGGQHTLSLPADAMLDSLALDAPGVRAYYVSIPFPLPPHRQELRELNLATGKHRVLCTFDTKIYYRTTVCLWDEQGKRVICQRRRWLAPPTGKDDPPEEADFVGVTAQGAVRVLTPLWRSQQATAGMEDTFLVALDAGGHRGLFWNGPRLFSWPLGETAPGAASAAEWVLPHAPYGCSASSRGAICAALPDRPDEAGRARLPVRVILREGGAQTEIFHGRASGSTYFSPSGRRLAIAVHGRVGNQVQRLCVYDVEQRQFTAQLDVARLGFVGPEKLRDCVWLDDKTLAFCTESSCHTWELGQEPVRVFDLGGEATSHGGVTARGQTAKHTTDDAGGVIGPSH